MIERGIVVRGVNAEFQDRRPIMRTSDGGRVVRFGELWGKECWGGDCHVVDEGIASEWR